MMRKDARSGCPINLSVEIFGDRWTLLVLRDIVFAGSRRYGELLRSEERISSNVLADRLALLVDRGLLTRDGDPAHKQKVVYSLTERAIELVPVLVQIAGWGSRHLPADDGPVALMGVLVDCGPDLCETFMDELREEHLGPEHRHRPAPAGPTVASQMEAAYLAACG